LVVERREGEAAAQSELQIGSIVHRETTSVGEMQRLAPGVRIGMRVRGDLEQAPVTSVCRARLAGKKAPLSRGKTQERTHDQTALFRSMPPLHCRSVSDRDCTGASSKQHRVGTGAPFAPVLTWSL
jgi:hypothetical protein